MAVAEACLHLAQRTHEQGAFEAAEKFYLQACDKLFSRWCVGLAQLYLATGKKNAAVTVFTRLARAYADDCDLVENYLRAFLAEQNDFELIANCQVTGHRFASLAEKKQVVEKITRALQLHHQGEFQKSIALKFAVCSLPVQPFCRANAAAFFAWANQFTAQSDAWLSASCRYEHQPACFLLGQRKHSAGLLNEAGALYLRLCEHDHARACAGLGMIWQARYDLKWARIYHRRACRLQFTDSCEWVETLSVEKNNTQTADSADG